MTDLNNKIYERFASMEARPEMWAGTQEAFGLQLVAFAEMLLWPDGHPSRTGMSELMKRVFGPGPVVSSIAIDADWATRAVTATRAFLAEQQAKPHVQGGPVTSPVEPIPMRITCPECGELHIDEGEFAQQLVAASSRLSTLDPFTQTDF